MPRLKTTCLLIVTFVLMATPAARAQTSDLAARLPADTLLYMYWRGADSLKPGSKNSLVSLWNDPGFQPMRQWIVQGLVEATARNPQLSQVRRKDIEALLADPFVFGIRLATQGSSAPTGPTTTASGFLVVQMEGKTGQELRADLQKNPKSMTNVRFTRSGLLLASGNPATLRALARQFGSGPAGSKSLSTLAAFAEARAEITGQPPIEFFMRVPEASSLAPRKAPGFDTKAFLQSLNLQRIHLLCGSIDLNEPSAFIHFAILGNPSPGGLFDLFGANVSSFQTLAAAPAGASIIVSRLNIGAVLFLFTNAFSAALGPDRAARLEMISGLLSSTVMPALGGEYAMIWPRLTAGEGSSLLALTVNPLPAASLFSTTLAPFLQPAGQEGEIRYFRVAGRSTGAAPGGAQDKSSPAGAKPAAAPQSMLLALTPHVVLIGRNEALLRRGARAVTAAAPATGLAATASFRAARAELPAQLSGLSYLDMQTFNWTKWLERMAARMAQNQKNPRAAERGAALDQWAKAGGGAVLARHVHLIFSGAWKDGQGVHWRGDVH
ncbi:MAG TPA: hypothetical protein VNJ12_09135 [Candidatus Dormibacteraeota bacterium]|nr:hypothetical protein [Candidatus Dormibacteraeota bacterium]